MYLRQRPCQAGARICAQVLFLMNQFIKLTLLCLQVLQCQRPGQRPANQGQMLVKQAWRSLFPAPGSPKPPSLHIHQPACVSYHPSDAALCQSQRCSSTAKPIPLGAAPIDSRSRGGWDTPRYVKLVDGGLGGSRSMPIIVLILH